MANTKGFDTRIEVIDQLLQLPEGASIAQMMAACNRRLEELDMPLVTATNTIRADIEWIEKKHSVLVVLVNEHTRSKKYHYEDPTFSIYKAPVSRADKERLEEIINSISMYEGRPQLEWVSDLKARLLSTIDLAVNEQETIIGFDENERLAGREFFKKISDKIRAKKAIRLLYRSFNSKEDLDIVVHPYYLRQYNNRWFLFAENEDRTDLTTYALDRIVYIGDTDKPYRPNNGRYDFKEYFKNIVGVSKPADAQVEHVQFLVDRKNYNYINTKPLHHSQDIVENRHEDGVVLQVDVIPNFELEQLILSYGEAITVLAPQTLREKITQRLKKSSQNYQ